MQSNHKKIKTALISVFDKSNIIKLSKKLKNQNIKIFSTHGTSEKLKENNIKTHAISEITKYPEILDGQIKTIHPKIFGGILGNKIKYKDIIKKYQITTFDIVVINFYPFKHTNTTINKQQNIDIGGPAIVRAAAKNYKNTVILTDPSDYNKILNEINKYGYVKINTKLKLAYKAFKYINKYDNIIKEYFYSKINQKQKKTENNLFPQKIKLTFYQKKQLKYGENPHQKAAFYTLNKKKNLGLISGSKQINGSELSYNNIHDAYIALKCVNQFKKPSCVIIKHGTPCGAASANDICSAYLSAYESDSISAFGGIIGFNKIINENTIDKILNKQFAELIIGPEISSKAIKLIKNHNKIKVLICGYPKNQNVPEFEFKTIGHDLLIQEPNQEINIREKITIVSKKKPNELEIKNAIFCWKIAKFSKSNSIVYGQNFKIISIGSGQTSRIDAVKIANSKYYQKVKNNKILKKNIIMASDAFFPFTDGIQEAISAGVSCIIQPGGSIKDQEVIKTVDDHNVCMIFTNIRSFSH